MSILRVQKIRHTASNTDVIDIANDGTCTANLSDFGRRNHVINGNFCISQRNGTTAYSGSDGYAGGYGGPDRWRVNQSGATTSLQQVAFAMGEQRSGSQYYAKFTSSGNDFSWMETRIEDVTKFHSQQITISFEAKYVSAKPAGGFNVRLVQNFGTGGSPSNANTVYWGGANNSESFVATTSWQRFQWNLTTDSLSGKTLGTAPNSSYLGLIIGQGANTTNTAWELNIANVQVEYGAVASAFEQPRSKGDELALCQRYYYVHVDGAISGSANEAIGTGTWYNGSEFYTAIHFPTTMRTAPSLDQTSGTNYYYQNAAGTGGGFSDFTSVWTSSPNMAYLSKTGSSGTQGAPAMVRTGSTSAKLAFKSEL